MSTRPDSGRILIGVTVLLTVVAASLLSAVPAHADTVGQGPGGQRLTVSKTTGVSRSGETLTVSGTGYDTTKGIYVAFCVDNGTGVTPSPCGGGADMSGDSGASQWISSNPPSYGEGLAIAYGPGGSFRVQIKVSTKIGDVDCTVRRCAVATRSDHTRTSDRSQDVLVPVTFAGQSAPTPGRTTAPAPARTGGVTAQPSSPTPAGAPAATTTSGTGTAAAGAPVASAGGTVAADPIPVTRVSSSSAAGRWWVGGSVLLAAAVVVLLLLRWRRPGGTA